MATSDRASWIDTEGTISLSSRTWEISIVQTEKKPLQDYSEGARRDGVRCYVRTFNNGTAFRARIVGLENVARELSLTEDLLRTGNRLSQVRRFKQYLFSPRRVRIQTLRARQIITDRLNQKSGASANLGRVMKQMVCKIPLNELRESRPRRGLMEAVERAVWIDTEGSLSLAHHTWEISISQSEKELLEDYCNGARKDGVKCSVTRTMHDQRICYRARIMGVENVAKELVLTKGLLRTENKLQQIEDFKWWLFAPRKTTAPQTLRARNLMAWF